MVNAYRSFTSLIVCVLMLVVSVASVGVASEMPKATVQTKVEIYTASYCGECKRAKAYMQAHKIAFTEYDVEQDRNRLREFYQRGGKGIPLIFIGGEMMHGFEQERFEELLAEPKNVPEANLVTRIAPAVVPAAGGPGANRQAQE